MASEEEFFATLLETFKIEADEHLKALSEGILALEENLPEEEGKRLVEKIFREAHSLKGAARSVNQGNIQEVCQSLESVLSEWKQGFLKPTKAMFDTFYATLDLIGQAISGSIDQTKMDAIILKLSSLAKNSGNAQIAEPSVAKEKPLESAHPTLDKLMQPEKQEPPKEKEKTIRMALAKIDKLFQETEEMLMVKLVTQQQYQDFKDIIIDLQIQEKESSKLLSEVQTLRPSLNRNGSDIYEHNKYKKILTFLDFQQQSLVALRESFTKLLHNSEQNVYFISSLVDILLDDIKKVLMQPISSLYEVIPRMVRDISHELGKDVQMEFEGGDIELDRRILEEIKDPIIHLIRNAVDHGVGTPEERLKVHKSPRGTVRIAAVESGGSNVEISVSDDGKGIDIEKIKQEALKKKLISEKEASELNEQAAIKLAFHSGISTARTLTNLSGRGLGLGIVSEKVDKLGGHLFIDTVKGKGTTFRLVLPLTLATFRGIHITVANQDFILPAHSVIRVFSIKKGQIKSVENRETINFDNQAVSYVHLANILNLTDTRSDLQKEQSIFILVIQCEEKTIALGADAIRCEREVLVKSLGKQCIRVQNFMAATILESGKVIPILNPIDLVRTTVKGGVGPSRSTILQDKEEPNKTILVVEDSITIRLLLKNILESAGYKIKTAVDGLEALEILQTQAVDLLLTDIEMPRMDGFVLIKRVREMPSLKNLPIIICSARGSQEDRELGVELGASAYLDKEHFTQQTLISSTQRLL